MAKRRSGAPGRRRPGGGQPGRDSGAAICFLIVIAAIAWGVYEVYVTGHPARH
ncbi:MAG TPA: hypothetical protein VGG75_15150 [Trebonia sp.]